MERDRSNAGGGREQGPRETTRLLIPADWCSPPTEHPKDHSLGLINAIRKQDLPRFRSLLDADEFAIEYMDENGSIALHEAAKLGSLDMVRLLVEKANPNRKDVDGCTALFYAVTASNFSVEMTELLLECGTEADLQNREGWTALYVALIADKPVSERLFKEDKTTLQIAIGECERGKGPEEPIVKIVKTLLDHGVAVDVTNPHPYGWNLLHIAATQGNLDVVKMLKDHKPFAAQKDNDGCTALHLAAKEGWVNVVEIILTDFGADPEAISEINRTPLHVASENGHVDVAKELVNRGANITAQTRSGCYPVNLACMKGHDKLALYLLQHMTRDQILSRGNARHPTILYDAATNNCIGVVERLWDYGKNDEEFYKMFSEIYQDCTVAYNAIEYGHEDVALCLLEFGVNSEGTDANRKNSLHWAAEKGLTKVVQYSVLNDPEFERKLAQTNKIGKTPLHCAAEALQEAIVLCFLNFQHANDPKPKKETTGWTALHWAAWYDRLDIVQIMAINKADIEKEDTAGLKAAEVISKDSPRFVEMQEWLTVPERHEITRSSKQTLDKPICLNGAEEICRNTNAYIMAIFPEHAIERSKFSVYNILYEFGPARIISAWADAYQIKDAVDLKWMHLPANNDLTQAVYYDSVYDQFKENRDGRLPHRTENSSKEILVPSNANPSQPSRKRFSWRPGSNSSMSSRDKYKETVEKYSRVSAFMNDCLSQDAGSNRARFQVSTAIF
ncbi:hypothetical protein NHQ30_003902 [Ciborinia camelliae]|nr:hypothetical protein NHQ30_003902 [Ciborinia camelliae]